MNIVQYEAPQELAPAIRRGRIEQLTIYEISDAELETFERGSPVALYLNFSIFFISAALSFLVALLSTNIASDRVFTIFVVMVTVFFALGSVLFALWLRNRVSIRALARLIRERVPPDGESADES